MFFLFIVRLRVAPCVLCCAVACCAVLLSLSHHLTRRPVCVSAVQFAMAVLRTQKVCAHSFCRAILSLLNASPCTQRLAASVLKCGKRKVWIDPNETAEISNANSRAFSRNHSN